MILESLKRIGSVSSKECIVSNMRNMIALSVLSKGTRVLRLLSDLLVHFKSPYRRLIKTKNKFYV